MARSQKITATLPVEAVEAIRTHVANGQADSVSDFVQHAVRVSLDDTAGWGAMLRDALQKTGEEMTPEERAWADEILGRSRSDVSGHGRLPGDGQIVARWRT